MMKQGEIRSTFAIRGDAISDCLLSWFCNCCSLIRMEKEVISRQQQQAEVSQMGYVAPPGGMVAAPSN